MHLFLLQSSSTCAQAFMSNPNYSMTLDPGHRFPPRLKTVKPRSPHPSPQTAEASGFRPGQRMAAGGQPAVGTAAPRWLGGNATKEKTPGVGTRPGATCGPEPTLPQESQRLHATSGIWCPHSCLGSPSFTRSSVMALYYR